MTFVGHTSAHPWPFSNPPTLTEGDSLPENGSHIEIDKATIRLVLEDETGKALYWFPVVDECGDGRAEIRMPLSKFAEALC